MKIMVVDDEPPARERLKQLIADIEGCEVCAEAENGEQALNQVISANPDVILLDIRMPGIDGIETAHHLASLAEPPAVIFTTAYSEHALDAFAAQAVGYLVKPVRKQRLEEALKVATRLTRAQISELARGQDTPSQRTHLCARVRGGLELIPIDDVLYFQADQKYVTVRHRRGEVLIEDSLKQLEQEFGERFVRIHRNALAATACLLGLEKTTRGAAVRLRDCPDSLDISRRHLPFVRKYLRNLGDTSSLGI